MKCQSLTRCPHIAKRSGWDSDPHASSWRFVSGEIPSERKLEIEKLSYAKSKVSMPLWLNKQGPWKPALPPPHMEESTALPGPHTLHSLAASAESCRERALGLIYGCVCCASIINLHPQDISVLVFIDQRQLVLKNALRFCQIITMEYLRKHSVVG